MVQQHLTPELRHARGNNGQQVDAGLAGRLGELARRLGAEPNRATLLRRITDSAVTEVDGASYAGLSLIERADVRTEAATDTVVRRLDEHQYALAQGPCMTALREQVAVRSDDLRHDNRWPDFAAAALDHGVHATLSVRLFVDGVTLGALNLYATKPHAFSDYDESVTMLLATHAALAMKASTAQTDLHGALASRDTIGQGKGILMERYNIGATEAFDLLVKASQRSERKLRDVADALATTGELKPEPT